MNVVRVSKFMSLVLRHDPKQAGLTLDANGWADLVTLCAATEKRFGASEDDIRRVVAGSDKQRFIIDGGRIRANQGHSVSVELDLKPVTPPAFLYHGTLKAFSTSIEAGGLNKGKRHHVHLSADTETAERVAVRRRKPWLIYTIAAGRMAEDGHRFFCSENGVWLTDHVPAKYLDSNTE